MNMRQAKETAKKVGKHWLWKFGELMIVMGVALIPMFVLAKEIDGDEWSKAAGTGMIAATLATIVTIYKSWRGNG